MGDVTSLCQVLVNLLSNAVKFTDRGDVAVYVTGRPQLDGRFELHFAVKDTGIGIPSDHMGQLFQSFSQADMSTTRKYGGTGLGLAISKRLVELMGGTIWVESEVGVGSTFHFTILTEPATPEQCGKMQESPKKVQAQANDFAKLRLLLAEDNLINQDVALRMLRKLGIEADVAANGREVLQAIAHRRYDIILMDVQMPEMDGFEAARKIRERFGDCGPHIIAVTAHALEGDRKRCIEAGMDDYISKPMRMAELHSALEKHYPDKRNMIKNYIEYNSDNVISEDWKNFATQCQSVAIIQNHSAIQIKK
jgi:CheY-like chemotaxis protein